MVSNPRLVFGYDGGVLRLPLADVLTTVVAAELFWPTQVGSAALVGLGAEQGVTARVLALAWGKVDGLVSGLVDWSVGRWIGQWIRGLVSGFVDWSVNSWICLAID